MNVWIIAGAASEEEAHKIVTKLFRKHDTWDERLEPKSGRETGTHYESGEKVDNDVKGATSHTTTRDNICPGEPSIGKIGSSTKEEIMRDLTFASGNTKWTEHMKLLWKRGEVKFDGKEYYL